MRGRERDSEREEREREREMEGETERGKRELMKSGLYSDVKATIINCVIMSLSMAVCVYAPLD